MIFFRHERNTGEESPHALFGDPLFVGRRPPNSLAWISASFRGKWAIVRKIFSFLGGRILPSCVFATAAVAQLTPPYFVTPLGGVPYEDWTIVNFVDLDSSSGLLDWNGGTYVYNGHDAIDITLANFAKMDAGVPILAAAAGVVTQVQDGFFDRCSSENPCPGGNVNYVTIDHGGGLVTQYLHLRTGSPSSFVKVNDVVAQGQQIGWVGSSGASSDAHLHFAVRQNGASVETYLDPSTYWTDPLPYPGDVPGALDSGVTNHNPDIVELRERPQDSKVIGVGPGADATMWLNLHGIKNDTLRVQWYRPDGSLFDTNNHFYSEIHYGWVGDTISLPLSSIGQWEAVATLNPSGENIELGRSTFYTALAGDVNLDGVLNQQDVDAFTSGWLYKQATADVSSWQKGDLNQDGKVDLFDLFELHEALKVTGVVRFVDFGGFAEVPEPAGLVMMLLTLPSTFALSKGRTLRSTKCLSCTKRLRSAPQLAALSRTECTP